MKTIVHLVLSLAGLAIVQPVFADDREDSIAEIQDLAEEIGVKARSTATDTAVLHRLIDQLRDISDRLGTGGSDDDDLICQPYSGGSYAYLTRSSDLRTLGNYVEMSVCRQIIQSARAGYVCEPYSGSSYAYVTRIADAQHIGNYVEMNACMSVVAATTRQLVCAPYSGSSYAYVTRTSDLQPMGNYVPMNTCQQILERSSSRYVCQPYSGSSYAYLTEIATGRTIGNYQLMGDCLANIPR